MPMGATFTPDSPSSLLLEVTSSWASGADLGLDLRPPLAAGLRVATLVGARPTKRLCIIPLAPSTFTAHTLPTKRFRSVRATVASSAHAVSHKISHQDLVIFFFFVNVNIIVRGRKEGFVRELREPVRP